MKAPGPTHRTRQPDLYQPLHRLPQRAPHRARLRSVPPHQGPTHSLFDRADSTQSDSLISMKHALANAFLA